MILPHYLKSPYPNIVRSFYLNYLLYCEPRNPSEYEFFVTFNSMLDFCGERLTACLTLKLEDGRLSADDYAASVYVHHAL